MSRTTGDERPDMKSQMTSRWFVVAAFVFALGASAGYPGESAKQDVTIKAYVSILPQAYFVERIGGPHIAVGVLVGPGQSPHTYEPTPKAVSNLSDADVYFKIGIPFEKSLLDKATRLFPNLHVVDIQAGIEFRRIEEHGHEEGDRGEGEADPHTWLDPHLVKTQATTIAAELKRLDPENAAEYDRNLKAFADDLDSVDARIATLLAPYRGSRFYVFHPSYGYFADRYGLVQVAVESEGKEPGAQRLADLIDHAHADGVTVLFAQPQFSSRTAEAIAHEIGAAVKPLDPLARDYLANLERMTEALAASWHGKKPGNNSGKGGDD
jgi:zinc transport system substrate-binding protein